MSACIYCGRSVNIDEDYRRTVGWERKASASGRRGGSDLVLREPDKPFKWACWGCVDKLKRGLAVGQEGLL